MSQSNADYVSLKTLEQQLIQNIAESILFDGTGSDSGHGASTGSSSSMDSQYDTCEICDGPIDDQYISRRNSL